MGDLERARAKPPYVSFAGYGVDVASKRADDLDKALTKHLQTKQSPKALDLGCGAGGQSLRMAKVGAEVTAVDKHDFNDTFSELKHELCSDEGSLNFIQGDLTELPVLLNSEVFDGVCLQRVLHYLTYDEAKELLSYLHKIVKDKLYVSVTGMGSDVGIDYLGKDVKIGDRYFKLNPEKAEIFSINEPVCLYTQDEFTELLALAGWKVEECKKSAFGNLKAVCTH